MTWIPVDYLDPDEFYNYLQTLPEDHRALELRQFSRRLAKKILKEEMEKWNCFYDFVEDYSSRDFKKINGIKHVSQRVLIKHVKYWNIIHPTNTIKKLRVFFI